MIKKYILNMCQLEIYFLFVPTCNLKISMLIHTRYDKAAKIAKTAHADGSTLREAAIKLKKFIFKHMTPKCLKSYQK